MKPVLLLTILTTLGSADAQSTRTIKLRTLCFEHVEDIREVLLVSGPKGDKTTPLKLWTTGFSDEITASITDNTIRFAIPAPDSEGDEALETVARGTAVDSDRQLAIFVPGTGKLPYDLVMLDDSEEGFPLGSTVSLNLAPTPIRLQIGEHKIQLKPGGKAVSPAPKKLNPRNQANVIVSFMDKTGKWLPVNNTRWQISPLKRNLAIGFIHPRTKQPTVNSYSEVPPWRMPELP